MPQTDTGAVDVGRLAIQPQIPLTADVLGGKGFVELDQLEIVDGQVMAIQKVPDRRHRGETHDRRMAGTASGGDDFGQRRNAQRLGFVGGHDHHGGRPVVDPRGVAGGDLADFGDEGRRQPLQLGHGQAGPEVLVPGENQGVFFALRDFHGNDFVFKRSVIVGPFGVVLTAQRHLVHLPAGNVHVLGDEFGRVSHNVGFADTQAQRRLRGIHRPIFRVRDDVGTAVQGVDHGIHKNGVLKTTAPAGIGDLIGHTAHVFHTTGQDHLGHAGLNHGHARQHGLHA